jgi:UPF0755 protein
VSRGRLLVLGLAALLVGAGVAAAGAALYLRGELAPVAAQAEPQLFQVPRGAHLPAIARDLEAAGLVRNARAFRLLARLQDRAHKVQAGEYELSATSSSEEILDVLTEGRVKLWEVVVPEGLRAAEIAARLGEARLADEAAFLAYALDPAHAEALGVAGPTLEGYLFPTTYKLPRGLAVREVAAAMVDQFLQVWAPLAPLAAERGLDMRQVVTLASIVEKETGAAEERPLIAGVFHNRLRKGMRLESDPTTIYGIEDFDGNLKRVHLEDGGNVYNTYKIEGLPPGPIASPGAAALRAVLEPAPTDFLYFVSRNDGTHVFARTFAEHEANVDTYQRRRRPKK